MTPSLGVCRWEFILLATTNYAQFLKSWRQVEDVSADYRLYFSEPMGYIHLATILLCAYVIVCPGYCSDFPLHARVVIPAPLPQLKGSIKRHIVKTC